MLSDAFCTLPDPSVKSRESMSALEGLKQACIEGRVPCYSPADTV